MIKKLIPQPIKTLLKDQVYLRLKDSADLISGRRDLHTPPTRLMFDGPIGLDEFKQNGQEFLALFQKLLSPKPSSSILDIGSGIGRKTLPLTTYLNQKGSYEGLEIVKTGVVWCKRHITSRFPNFHFTHVDLFNGFYNPKGEIKPSSFVFPYQNNSFDIAIATSVFTHMLPLDVKNYLQEIARVLKSGGQSYLTYFLINPDSQKRLTAPGNTLAFKSTKKNYWTTTPKTPEIAIAFDESQIRDFYQKAGLKIQKIHYGSWPGRPDSLCYQDIIIAIK